MWATSHATVSVWRTGLLEVEIGGAGIVARRVAGQVDKCR